MRNEILAKVVEKAVNEVPESYYRVHYVEERIKVPQRAERVFCYEFYHRLRLKLGDVFPFRLDGEITKKEYLNLQEVTEEPTLTKIIPDFVLHKDQSNSEEEKQRCIIEVKAVDIIALSDIKKDISKLLKCLDKRGKLRYQQAIFICINTPFDSITGKIVEGVKEYQEIGDEENFKKLFVIGGIYGRIDCKTLQEIIEKN